LKKVRSGSDNSLATKKTDHIGWITKRINGNHQGHFYIKVSERNAGFGTRAPAKSGTTTIYF
jgi:hypothetical protein